MTQKKNLTYRLFIQNPPTAQLKYSDEFITAVEAGFVEPSKIKEWQNSELFTEISYPFTLDFDIQKTTTSSNNFGYFSIYNLSEKTRNLISKDRFTQNDLGNGLERRKIIFLAGYNDNLTTCFVGNLLEASSDREGVDIITKIEASDGFYETANSIVNNTIENSTSEEITRQLITGLGLEVGKLGDVFGTNPQRGVVLQGNTYEELQRLHQGNIFIDHERVYILNPIEAILGDVNVINSESGLLGIPKRAGSFIEIDVIFEPSLRLGQLIEVQSQLDKRFNGQFKLVGIDHSGTISGAVSGENITHLQLMISDFYLGGLQIV